MTGSQFTRPNLPAQQGPSHLGRTSGEENRPINAPTELEADENRLRFDRSRIPVFNSEAPPNRLPPGQSPAARLDDQADAIVHATAPVFIDRNLFPRSSDYPSEQVPSDSSSFIHPAPPSYEQTIPSAQIPNFEGRSDLGSNLTDIRNLPNQVEIKNPSGNPQTLPQENPFESYPGRSVTNEPSNNVAASPYTHLDRSIPIKAHASQYHVADSQHIDDDSEASFDAEHGASKAHFEADRHHSEESHNSSVEDGHDELVPHAATPSITASSGGPKDKRLNEVGPQSRQEPCEDLHAGRSPHYGYLSTPTGELDKVHRQEDPLYEAELTPSMDFSHGRAEENRFDPVRPQPHVQQDEHFQAGRSSTMKGNTAPRGEPEKGHRQQDQPHAGDFQVEKTTAHEIDQAPPIKKSIATFHSPTKEHDLNESSKDIFSAHLTADLDPRPEFSFSPQVTHSKPNSPQSSEASLPLHSSSRGSKHDNQSLYNSPQPVLHTEQAVQDHLSDNFFAGDAKIPETILPNRQESSQSRSDFYHFPPYSSGLDSEASQGISNCDREEDLSQECRSGDSATDDQDHHHRQISGPSPATEKTRRKFYFNPELAASRNLDANETTVAMNIVPPNEEVLDTEETQAALPGFELVSTLSEHTPVAGQVMGAHTDDKTYSTQAHDRTEHISDSSSSADIPIESTVSATNQGHARSISMTQQSSSSDNQNSIIIYSDHPPTQETHDTISESPSGNSQLLEEMQGSSLDDQESHRVLDKVFDFSSTDDQRHDESLDASQSPPEQSEVPIREPLRREPPANPSVLVTAEKENPEVGFFRGSTSTLSTRPYRSSSHESESEVSGEAVETLGEHLRPRHSILEPESEAAQEEASSDGEVDSHHEDNSHNRDRYELENVMDEEEFLPPGQEPTPYDMEGSEASFSDEDLDYSYTGDVPTTHLSTITELSESLAEAHLSRSPLSQNWPSQSSPAVQHESHIDEEPLGYTETHPVQLERTASLADSSLAEDVREDIPPRLEDSSQSHEITVEPDDNQSRSLQRTSNQELASSSHNSPRDIPVPQDDGSMVEHEMFGQEDSLSDVGHEHGPNTSTELDQSSYLKESELIPAAHNTESFVPPLAVPTAIPANEVQINQSTVSNHQSAAQSDFHTEAMLTVDNLVDEVLSMIPEQNNKSIVLDSPVPAETHSFDNRSIEQEESGRATPDSVLHASIREVTSDKVADSQETEAERIAHSDSAEPPSHPLKDDSLQLSVSDASAGTLDENTREVVSDPLSGNHETPVQHHPEAVEPPSQPPHEDSSQLVVGDEKHDEVEISRNEVRDSSDAADGPAITPVSPQEPLPDHNELPTLLSAALPTPEPAEFIEATASSEAQDVPTPAHSELPHEASIPVDILEEEVSSPTTKPLTEAVVIDQLLPVLTERPRNHTTGHAEEDAIERATPSNQSILDIVDQVSGHTEIEERPSHPSPTDEDSAGLSQVAPQNIPIPEDSTRLEEHEDIGLDDSFKDNTGHENAMITSPTTLAPTITAPPGDGIEAMQTSEAQAIDSQNDAVHPADGLVEEATSLSEKAAEQIINHEVAEALSQSPKDNSPHLVVGNANEEKVEIHSSHLSDVKDAVGDPASPTEEIPSNDLLADDPNLKSQPAQALVATEPPSVETKNLEELTGKGTTESSEPTDESTSPSLATDRLLVETEGPERHTIEHAETEIHAVAAEQIPNSPAKVPSHPQTDDITQIISSDPKDEMVGTPSKRFQDPSGAEEVRSTTTAPPEQLQPAISQESTIQPTLAPAAQPTPGPVDATDGIKAPGAQVLHSTIAETDTGPAQSEINTEAELTVKSSAENAPSSSLSSELPQDNAVLDQQISAETGSLEHHPTKPPMPFDATESIAPPVNVKDTIPSSEVEVQANDKVSGNTAIETNPLQPILSNGDLAGFSPVPPQDVPIPESKASVAPQDIPIPESKASMTEPETGKQDDSLRLDLGHADTAPPSPLDKSSPEGHESISALGSSESVVAPVDATETTSASVAQTIQPSGDRQLQIEIESLDNHDMEQALQLPRSPEELESKPTTDLEVSREGVPHDGTQDSESTSIDAEAAPQEAEPAPQEAEPVPQESKPAPQETELSPQESESAPLEAESAPQESGQLLKNLSQLLKTPSQLFKRLRQLLNNPSQLLERPSQFLRNLSQLLKNLSQLLKNPSQLLKTHSQLPKRLRQLLNHPSQLLERPSHFLRNPSQLLKNLSQLLKNLRQLLKNPSQLLKKLSQLFKNPSQLLKNLNQFLRRPSQLLKTPSQLFKNLRQLLKNLSQLLKNPSQLLKRPTQFLKLPSQLLKNPSQLLTTHSQLLKRLRQLLTSQLLKNLRQLLKNLSQLLQTPSQLLKRPSQLLKTHSQLLKRLRQLLKNPSQLLKRPSQFLKNPSQLLKNLNQLLRRPSQLLKTPSQLFKNLRQLLKNPSQLLKNPSQLLKRPSQFLKNPSQLLKNLNQLLRRPSQLLKTPSQLFKNLRQLLKNPSQPLKNLSQLLKRQSQSLKNLSQLLKNLSQLPKNLRQLLKNLSQLLKRLRQLLKNPSQPLKNLNQLLRRLSQLLKTPSQLFKNLRQLLKNPSQPLKNPSQLLKRPTQFLKNPSQLLKNPSQLLMTHSQLLKRLRQLLKNLSQLLKKLSQLLKRLSQLLKNLRQLIKNLSQLLKTPSQLLKRPSQLLKTHSQLLKRPSQLLKNPSQLLKNLSQLLKRLSQLLKTPSQLLKNPSQPLKNPSQLLKRPSHQLLKRLRQLLKNPSQLLKNPSQLLKNLSQLLKRLSQLLKSLIQLLKTPSQLLKRLSQLLKTHSQLLKTHSQLLKRLRQLLKNPSQLLKNPSQLLKNLRQLLERPSQLLKNPGQLLKNPSQFLKYPSQLLKRPSQLLKRLSQLLKNPSQLIMNLSQLLKNLSQLLKTPSQLLKIPSQLLKNLSQLLKNPSQLLKRLSQLLKRPSKNPSQLLKKQSHLLKNPSQLPKRLSQLLKNPSQLLKRPSQLPKNLSQVLKNPSQLLKSWTQLPKSRLSMQQSV
ncbi:uncharacterized protein PGTG_04255 [Puccinia graminis f. sp. tritici CRL 75-36-700-3]|uniref:Uncharacterized protein n=1 Tax=Puccinia graminis f. sp. tritici (strain CRL 75-36-700-3 / race SCCL) TaxID=418459 RepID=E3K2X9_PUCGT|nr:uncharacterized protein PGTG_04255 [Puccinia graminis f. sp. tritici CRL 75-36-700-3]EFP78299.2 hypothetical protein PGTG_04255 [Puccinia graminis f. sp. tritici CRL 75-36-700-3]